MTRRQIQARVGAGWLVPQHRSVYRLAGGRSSPEQSLLAACMAAGPTAAASHRSAGMLWGLRGLEELPAEITVAGDRHRQMAGVTVHRTDRLEPVDLTHKSRIPATTPARTLLDLGAVVPGHVMESALEDALMRRLVTLELLLTTIARLGGPGRRGAGVLRRFVEERDPATASTQSALEDAFLRLLRRARPCEPVRQHEVAGVRLDFAYPDLKLGIEADSRCWHGGPADVQRNSDKANRLLGRGWRVLHFTWADVRDRPAYVVHHVAGEVAVACPA